VELGFLWNGWNDNQHIFRRDISRQEESRTNPACNEENCAHPERLHVRRRNFIDMFVSERPAALRASKIAYARRVRLRTSRADSYRSRLDTIVAAWISGYFVGKTTPLRWCVCKTAVPFSCQPARRSKPKERVNTSYRIFVHLRNRRGCRQRERLISISMLSSGSRRIRLEYRFSYGAASRVATYH